jgi:DNA-binding MarR family transcriptional regulator
MTTFRQGRILHYLHSVGGRASVTDLPKNGTSTVKSLAEHGFIEVRLVLTEKGRAAAEAAIAAGIR